MAAPAYTSKPRVRAEWGIEMDANTVAVMIHDLALLLPPDDPERRFTEWLCRNAGRLRAACWDLGIDPGSIPEGPGLSGRLRDAVTPLLSVEEPTA